MSIDLSQSPALDSQAAGVARVVLKPKKSKPFFGRHPWVLDSAVDRVEGHASDGDVVDLLTEKDKFIARGIFNSRSRIRVRLYTWNPGEPLDGDFWRARLAAAVELRRTLGYDNPQGACRLVFSEADHLSGLIVDRYANYLAVQTTGLAMSRRLDVIVPALVAATGARGVMLRGERGIGQQEGIEVTDGLYSGEAPDGPIFIEEHGVRYAVDLAQGQKTGFYVDQRENRRVAADYLRGRRVLDMFCYTGGFSVCASKLGHAKEVLGIDTSAKAIAMARGNAQLNGLANLHFEAADAFEKADALIASGRRFDAVVLDPPKFARSRQSVNDALMAYHRINRTAVDLLPPGGILITCSCSGHVSREDFLYMLSGVSQRTGRSIQILEQRGPAPDHPVSATCLESDYLKCFICRVG